MAPPPPLPADLVQKPVCRCGQTHTGCCAKIPSDEGDVTCNRAPVGVVAEPAPIDGGPRRAEWACAAHFPKIWQDRIDHPQRRVFMIVPLTDEPEERAAIVEESSARAGAS
jgi:hypothetical protein